MIQIKQLHKSYDGIVAIDNMDLNIRDGAITGLLGPNGAAKTTLVSILTGIIKKDSGSVFINNMDLDKNPDDIKSISCIVPQSLAIYPMLTAYENLEYFGVLYGLKGKKLKERIDFSIEAASLKTFVNKQSGKFSGGMQRRLNLAVGLLNNPKILYLDEPTVGVDAQSRNYMLEMIRRINIEEKTTIIYTSHYISEIQNISDDIVIIDSGRILLSGSMHEILSRNNTLDIEVDSIDQSVSAVISEIEGVSFADNSIHVERKNGFYNNTIDVLSILDKNKIIIKNMLYNSNRLEELYLHLTNKELRDEE